MFYGELRKVKGGVNGKIRWGPVVVENGPCNVIGGLTLETKTRRDQDPIKWFSVGLHPTK